MWLFLSIRLALRAAIWSATALLVAACANTARFPDNPPLERYQPVMPQQDRHDDTLLVLTFSGGGSRAAALSYGVLQALHETKVQGRALTGEIDLISAVSGGSITAAYYGLFGDRLFTDFFPEFLDRDVESELKRTMLDAANLFRLTSPTFGSGDLLDEYLRSALFGDHALSELLDLQGPQVEINATDLFKGERFGFTDEQFGMICSDPAGFPVARAVAASSAVPLLFSPITLQNRAGSCGYEPPPWLREALAQKAHDNRRYRAAVRIEHYLDRAASPYLHLVDGGLSDNLGLRAVLDRVVVSGGAFRALRRSGEIGADRIVLIVVDAASRPPSKWDQRPEAPPEIAVLDAATNAPLINFNFETREYLRSHLAAWLEEIRTGRCGADPDCRGPEFHLIDIRLDEIEDKQLRDRLTAVPTGLTLKPGVAGELVETGAQLLRANPEFRRWVESLR